MTLDALSPLDGRYLSKTQSLRPYFSEAALIQYRLKTEVVYLQHLVQALDIELPNGFLSFLEQLDTSALIQEVKQIEAQTHHDVKAVEYALKNAFEAAGYGELTAWIHWGLTSEDVNNLAYGQMLQGAVTQVIMPAFDTVLKRLHALILKEAPTPMLARTHGQAASPTTVGKEYALFAHRLLKELQHLETLLPIGGKQNGATGNWHVHASFFPEHDWQGFSEDLIAALGLSYEPLSSQIVVRESYAQVFHSLSRLNQILIDLCRDTWQYIALGYFQLKLRSETEVGSSTMPHKVNPVQFENAEGNFELANALLIFFADKLTKSRLQRDLSDSTVLRNMGTGLGHVLLALKSLDRGLSQLQCNRPLLADELAHHWEVLAEPLQHALRLDNRPVPYDQLRKATQGQTMDATSHAALLESLQVSLPVESPADYTGLAVRVARQVAGVLEEYLGL